MILSFNWLKEYLPNLQLSPEDVAARLTLQSFETKVARDFKLDDKITVAKITKLEPHPNADRLRLATITTGSETVTVVCGAPNIKVGDIVPFSPTGTSLNDDEGQSFILKPAKIRGILSPGMLNSPRELGLGNWHGGIYVLPPDTPLGSKLSDHLPNDTILEADITANRAHDCLSHLGLAHELAAILSLPLSEPDLSKFEAPALSDFSLNISDPTDVPRYLLARLSNIKVGSSPLWLQARLWMVGLRPINNVVDITNYVMLALGNPTHAFDANKLPANNIGTRRAKTGETLTTLDNTEHALEPTNLLIVSQDKPLALAGVMGGLSSQISENTTQVLLEVANFSPYLIHQSAATLKISTDSASRFSKGLAPSIVSPTARLAIELLTNLAGAKLDGLLDQYPHPPKPQAIKLDLSRVSALAGINIEPDQAAGYLQRLRCEVNSTNNPWSVIPPSDRLDLTDSIDLIEEIIRLHGLENIPARQGEARPSGRPDTLLPISSWRESLRDLLVKEGCTETYNYSFDDRATHPLIDFQFKPENALEIINPPSPEQAYLRTSLVPRVVEQVLSNKAELASPFNHDQAFFEISTVFRPGSGGLVKGIVEEEMLAIALVGEARTTAPALAQNILDLFDLSAKTDLLPLQQFDSTSLLGRKLRQSVTVITANLSSIYQLTKATPPYIPSAKQGIKTYKPPSQYPPVFRDLAVFVDAKITSSQLEKIIREQGGNQIAALALFDEFKPQNQNKISYAFHLAYQSPNKTLTDKEVNHLHEKIISALKKDLQAELRQ